MRRTIVLIIFILSLMLPSVVAADDPPKNIITQRSGNLRSGPGTNYPVVGSLEAGTRVTIIRVVQGQAISNGNTVWYDLGQNRFLYSGLTVQPQIAQAAPMPEETRGSVTAAGIHVNLRAEPRTGAPVVETIADGAQIEVRGAAYGDELDAGNQIWYDLGGKYIYSGLVRMGPPPQAPEASGYEVPGIGWYLVGQNSTSYRNSDWGREINIRISTAQINGRIIASGERFSLNNTLGPTVASAGYKLSQGVAGGQVVPSMGGGVCQTATTLYRAVLLAGLPINERINHSLRMHWYEDMPGLDAAIDDYGPYFSFTNDTATPLLIRAVLDEQTSTQIVQILSTQPGKRSVRFEGPFGSWNAVTVHRIITYEDGQFKRETITSYYER